MADGVCNTLYEGMIRYAAEHRATVVARWRRAFDDVLEAIKTRNIQSAHTHMRLAQAFTSREAQLHMLLARGSLVQE